MRKRGSFTRAVVVLMVFAVAFMGLPFGPPLKGDWPDLGKLLGFSTPTASAAAPPSTVQA